MSVEYRTKTHELIVLAFNRGFRIRENNIVSPHGRVLSNKIYKGANYPKFNIHVNGDTYALPIHKLAAYQFFGDAAFAVNVDVRHLDGDKLNFSKENIRLGTRRQNALDVPENLRKHRIKAASEARVAEQRHLTVEEVEELRSAYQRLKGNRAPRGFLKQLAEKYGVSRSVAFYAATGRTYSEVLK